MTNAVFVYGLLKPGFRLHHVIAPFVQRSAPGTTRGRLYAAAYPAARFDEDGEIEGVVLWLDRARLDEALRLLDDVEDEGEMYERIVIDASTGEGIVPAHAYQYLLEIDRTLDVGRTWQ